VASNWGYARGEISGPRTMTALYPGSRPDGAVFPSPARGTLRYEESCDTKPVLDVAIALAEGPVKQLIQYLLDNLQLDFSGNLSLEAVRDFLKGDDSREARALLGKLVEDRGVDEMMITLADCLQDYIKTGITDETVREQIRLYAES
jgi:hypothetical protein